MIREVRLRRLAASDIDSAVDYCQQEAGTAVANGFIDAGSAGAVADIAASGIVLFGPTRYLRERAGA